ncbi:MAG TPA: class I SAM-dependent methyltransferase [Candidatus Binatia bacterium]
MVPIADLLAGGGLDELNFYFAPQAVLFTALKLGIFEALAGGALDAGALAAATGNSQRGAAMLLDCMASMGLLDKAGSAYALNDLARCHFLRSGENYLGSLFIRSDQLLKLWLGLPEAVKTGRPVLPDLPERDRERLNLDIVEALFHVHKAAAWKLAALFQPELPSGPDEIQILDVAAGSAVWSLPFALQSPRARVTAVDFTPVLELAKRFAGEFGVSDRYAYIAGDIGTMEWRAEAYDLALLGHICHSEGAAGTRRLLEKCLRALKKNGKLLILDYFPDEERKSALMPLLLALNALLGTAEGDTFTVSEYRRWLSAAGFREIRVLGDAERAPAILAVKG